MMGGTRRQRWRNKDGKRKSGVYRYYQCQSRNNQSVCGYHTWRAALLEATVVSQLGLALQAKRNKDETPAPDEERTSQLRSIWEDRVRNAERRFIQALRRAARGAASVGTFASCLDVLDTARAGVQRANDATDMAQTLEDWDQLDFGARRDSLPAHLVRGAVKDEMVPVAG